MKNFTYYRPTTAEQAVALLENRWGNTELLAGGTDLLDLQKEYIAQPGRVVSLTGIGGLAGIAVDEQTASRIGAGTKLAAIADHAELQRAVPGADRRPRARSAARRSATWARSAATCASATAAGTSATSTSTACSRAAKAASPWTARTSTTPSSPRATAASSSIPSTLAPALIALGATAEVLGPQGPRTVELAKFFHAPTGPNEREHTLAANEMVLSVTIPVRGLDQRQLRGAAQAVVRLAAGAGGGRLPGRPQRRQGDGRARSCWATWRRRRIVAEAAASAPGEPRRSPRRPPPPPAAPPPKGPSR